MNIQQKINKLLYALSKKDRLYKVNSFKFYSKSSNKYCIKYQILKRELIPIDTDLDLEDGEIEYKEKYKVIYESYNKVDLLKYLIEEYRQGSEADE